MGDEGRPFRRRPLYYVANRGSDESDEGANSEDDRSPYYHHAYLSSPQQSPHPRVHPHPPALTTSFPSPYTHDNNSKHPSLSSPSSASSQAADESTPPPTTPSVTLPLSSCPPVSIKPTAQHSQDSISLGDRFPSDHSLTSNGRPRYMQPFLSRGSNARAPVESNPVGRPRTSPVASPPLEPHPSTSSYTTPTSTKPLSSPEVIKVCVRTDADPNTLNIVDVSTADDAAHIRDCIFSMFKISGDDQSNYAIYRTEIGLNAIGEPLSNEQLCELVRRQGDSKGNLKLLISRFSKIHDIQPSLPPLMPTPPVMDQPMHLPTINPLRPKRPPRSRQGSVSSAASEQPAEFEYDADLDRDPDESYKPHVVRQPPPPILPLHVASYPYPTPPSPRRRPNGQPLPKPPSTYTHPQPPSPVNVNKPPTPPTAGRPTYSTHTQRPLQDTYAYALAPMTGLSSPSPHFYGAQQDATLMPPTKLQTHQRSGSDAGAEREQILKESEAREALAQQRRKQEGSGAMTRPIGSRRQPSLVEDDVRDTWVMVPEGDYPQEPTQQLRDPPRTSPTLTRSPRTAVGSRYIYRAGMSSQSKSTGQSTSPSGASESRLTRSTNKLVPFGHLVKWKGEEGSRKPMSKDSTRSMDNLRQPGRRAQAVPPPPPSTLPLSRPREPPAGYQNPNSSNPSSSGIPRSYEHPRPPRPLPVQGSAYGSSSDVGGGPSFNQSRQPPPRLAAYPSPPSTRTTFSTTGPDPYPRPRSAADSPTLSPIYGSRQAQIGTYSSLHTPGEPAKSPRGVSPSRPYPVNGPRPLPVHSDRSDRSPEAHSGGETNVSSPPQTPISPSTVNDSPSESATLIVEPFSPGSDSGTYIPTAPRSDTRPNGVPPSDETATKDKVLDHMFPGFTVNDNSDSDEGDGGTWKVPLRRPELTPLKTNNLDSNQTVLPLRTQFNDAPPHPQPDRTHYNERPSSPPPSHSIPFPTPAQRPSQPSRPANTDHRISKFAEPADDWAPRPLPEVIYERLEEFFVEHDLDNPIIEASSGSNSPTNPEPAQPTPPPPPSATTPVAQALNDKARLRSQKKSIRLVAEERRRLSRVDPLYQDHNAVSRKRSTKMWGSRLEEVNTMQVKNFSANNTIPESPQTSKSTKPTFKWVRGELIGKGTYGRVYLAMNAHTGEMIAVKQVELPQTPSDKNDNRQATVVQALKMESETLKDLDHPNIVQYLGFEETPTNLSIFLEYVPGGSVGSCLHKHGKFNENVVISFTSQILSGLEYLHSKGILHRDLKADNILVEMSGVCKISDFGISKRTDDIYGGAFTAMQGTVFWMAPEVINTQPGGYNFKVDIWSVGCVVLEMWGGRRPWTGQEMVAVMFKLYEAKLPPPVPDDVILSELADDFRKKCFAINPEERATAAELRRHPYLELPPGWVFTSFT